MVVVQPFTEGEDRGHQLVGRAVIELIAAITVATVAMADRVDQRGGEHHQVGAQQAGEQHAADHGVDAANGVANGGRNENSRHRVPEPARSHEEHRDRVGQNIPGVVFAVGRDMVEHPTALRMQHALDEADIAVAGAVIVRAVNIAGLVGVKMMPAMVGDPFEHRALHRHRADRSEERPHHRTAAKAPVHEQAMHACAHPEHGQPEHAGEDRNLHPADALHDRPHHRCDRTGVKNGEHGVGIRAAWRPPPDLRRSRPAAVVRHFPPAPNSELRSFQPIHSWKINSAATHCTGAAHLQQEPGRPRQRGTGSEKYAVRSAFSSMLTHPGLLTHSASTGFS